ncbi:MAG: DUF1499 domain-containing protein [Balneolaceae bacterium]|nr:DUF1499 domain-containing protein [Balneolaceae bacterium]MCH8549745.1 DUF1499 domain-containing protein [Balneolaceae bacterium]
MAAATLFALFFLQGSTSSDLPNSPGDHPFEECPSSPNCIIQSVPYSFDAEELFQKAESALEGMRTEEITSDSQSLQIEAVFRIRLFGFKDDVRIAIDSTDDGSILHIRSASRTGYSDLGVNRRRVERILNRIDQQT